MFAGLAQTSDAGGPAPTGGRGAAEPAVLIVDDAVVDRHKAGGIVAHSLGWRLLYADNGRAALAALERDMPSVVLTDMQMPEMGGLELVDALRSKYPQLPVVLMTAHGSEDIAVQALQRGAASYVPKRNLARELPDILRQVQAAAEAGQRHQRLIECLRQMESRYVLANDPALIRALVAHLQKTLSDLNLCNDRRRLRVGIALEEALTNALYHGNLEVNSELRQQGDGKSYTRLAEERRLLPPYRDRRIHVRVELDRENAVFSIRDEGPGFNPDALPDPTNPENMEKASGRGLLLIRTFLDEVTFNEAGNEITLRMRCTSSVEGRS